MAKEAPWFRFTVLEWQNGEISNLSDSLKGLFIDICAYYWAKNCNITLDSLLTKFKTKSKSIDKLIQNQIISIQNANETNQNVIVSISFLDKQLSELQQNKTKFSEWGKLGQKAKKLKAPLKSDLSYKIREEEKRKEDIREDKEQTHEEWEREYLSRFPEETLNATNEDLP
jgi:hypothetical protein